MESRQPLGTEASQRRSRRGQFPQRSGQRQHVARVGGFEGDSTEQALQVKNPIQRSSKFFAADRFLYL